MSAINNVILVHGAWADGSCWAKIIPILVGRGLNVTAVQMPLTSFQQDVATVKRALALVEKPVLLVGHSYGGAVITEAGNDPKVAGFVYVAAFAPDAGESAFALQGTVTPAPLTAEFRPDAEGFLKMTRKGYFEDFGQDLTEAEKTVLFAAHAPTNVASLSGVISAAAWKNKPSSYVIAANDRAINPALQVTMSGRIKAKTITLETSHLAMLAKPDEVAELVLAATQ